MFPEIDYDFEAEEVEEVTKVSTQIGRTPLFDFKKNQYVIKDGKIVECTQEEAVRQWVGFLVKTAAEKFEVHKETGFGTYIENYIGYKDKAFVGNEIEREVKEKAPENRAISSIEDFEYRKEGNKMIISLRIVMVDETEVEVEEIV